MVSWRALVVKPGLPMARWLAGNAEAGAAKPRARRGGPIAHGNTHARATTAAGQGEVVRRRAKYGRNELEPDEGTPFWKLVLKQFDDLLVKILIVAAFVSFVLAIVDGASGFEAFVEPGVILLILVLNAVVGVVTENNAEKAIEELKAYEADVATVLRNGRLVIIPAGDLVPGDVQELERLAGNARDQT